MKSRGLIITSILVCSFLFIPAAYWTSSLTWRTENTCDPLISEDQFSKHELFVTSADNETTILPTVIHSNLYYGWVGNFSIIYWDVNASVGIPDANVSCVSVNLMTNVFDLVNGTYLIEVNTTYCCVDCWVILFIEFDKSGFERQSVAFAIRVLSVPTDLVVHTPPENQVDGDPIDLVIPLGDSVDILFSYNDTEVTNDYPRGLEGAYTEGYIGYVIGSTLIQHPIELTENGNGFYNFTFDTTDEWLYLSIGETPVSHYSWYHLYVEFTLANSHTQECLILINIIDIPTELVVDPWMEELYFEPGINSIFVSLIDNWPTHSGVAIQNLNITVESSDPSILEVISISNVSTEPGLYNITFNNKGRMEYVDVTILVEKEGYESQEWEQRVFLDYYKPPGPWPIPPVLPFLIVVIGVLLYRRKNRLHPSEEIPESG